MTFNTVVQYVKNLFPNRSPVQINYNREDDINALAFAADRNFYVVARNKKHYWYYVPFVNYQDAVQAIFKRNGIKAEKHTSRYDLLGPMVVYRILKSDIENNPETEKFVDAVINNTAIFKEDVYGKTKDYLFELLDSNKKVKVR